MEKNSRNTEDALVIDFLTKNKHEIPDNGFTQKVKQQLPTRLNVYEQIMYFVFAVAGTLLLIYLKIWDVLWHYAKECYAYLIALFGQNSYADFDIKQFFLESNDQSFSALFAVASIVLITLLLKSRQYERRS